jgi:carbamate kinase
MAQKETIVIALGGNALIKKGQQGTASDQLENLHVPVRQIAALVDVYNIVITHGNGPQVGNLLLQQEATDKVPKMPLEILVAQTQGQIGYMIESVMDEALMERGIEFHPLVSLISYVVVDEKDPAFQNPTKPIGPYFSVEEAAHLEYPTIETPRGYRRVVASPYPVTIIEKNEVKQLIQQNFIVICCGGGGIPVVRNGRAFQGVDAVIDKDLASSVLAVEAGADLLVIATDVAGVMENFNTPDERLIDRMSPVDAEAFLQNDKNGTGSMAPKVTAAMNFARRTGKCAVITSVEKITEAINGEAGTKIE